jgi:hypothetical protein
MTKQLTKQTVGVAVAGTGFIGPAMWRACAEMEFEFWA